MDPGNARSEFHEFADDPELKIREPTNPEGHEMVMLLHGWTSAAAITAQLKDRLIFIRDFQVSGVNTHAEPRFSK